MFWLRVGLKKIQLFILTTKHHYTCRLKEKLFSRSIVILHYCVLQGYHLLNQYASSQIRNKNHRWKPGTHGRWREERRVINSVFPTISKKSIGKIPNFYSTHLSLQVPFINSILTITRVREFKQRVIPMIWCIFYTHPLFLIEH